jgi:hypothetical protein
MDYIEFLNIFPSIKFSFDDKEFYWHPNDYLIREYKVNDSMKIQKTESFSFGFMPHHKLILGATFMRNYEIKFDMNNGNTFFVRCDCSKEPHF